MAARPIDRESVAGFRDELLEFAQFLDTIGNSFFPPVFLDHARRLEHATSISEVREVQRELRVYLKGTIGTLNDGPPSDVTSPRYSYTGDIPTLHTEFEAHMTKFRSYLKRVFWG